LGDALVDPLKLPECEALELAHDDSLTDGDVVCVSDADAHLLPTAVVVGERETVLERGADADVDLVTDGEDCALHDGVEEGEGERLEPVLAVPDETGDGEGDVKVLRVPLRVLEDEMAGEAVLARVGLLAIDAVDHPLALNDELPWPLKDALGDALGLLESDGEADGDTVTTVDRESDVEGRGRRRS
jgi:hypothetical protein